MKYVSHYRPPSDLANAIRDHLRELHQNCPGGGICGARSATVEDIQEILDEAAAIQNREAMQCPS